MDGTRRQPGRHRNHSTGDPREEAPGARLLNAREGGSEWHRGAWLPTEVSCGIAVLAELCLGAPPRDARMEHTNLLPEILTEISDTAMIIYFKNPLFQIAVLQECTLLAI